MKKSIFLNVFCFVALWVLPGAALADSDWDFMQHDYSVSRSNLAVSARHFSGTDVDYYHGQVDVNMTDNAVATFRYADLNGAFQEYRAALSYAVYADDTFYLTPVLAYRHFEGVSGLDHFRFGVRAGGQHTFGERFTAWGWHEPRFVFGLDQSGFEFDGAKSEFGVSVPIGRISVGPFVQVITDTSYQNIFMIAGTKFEIKL